MKNNKLPDGWQYIKISDLTDVITGGTPSTNKSEYWDGGDIPWLPSGDCKDSVINSATKFITEEGLKNSAAKLMPINTVVIALTGATTGKVGILNIEASANQSVTGIVPNEKFVPKYIFYYLRSIREKILNDSYGGAQKHISQGYVKDIQVLLPSLNTQKKIVEILERAEKALEKRKEAIKLLDELVKSRFIEMFGHLESNVYKFDKLKIKEICKKITDGTHKTPKYISDGIKFISAKDIKIGKIDLTDTKYISLKEYEEIQKRCQLEKGDILLSKSGSIGTPAILDTDEPLGIFESLAALKLQNNIVNNVYICEFLKSDSAQRRIVFGTKGISIKHLHLNVLKELDILIPPIELQNQFADFVKQVDKLKFEMEASLKELEDNFNSLMQRAFNGELFN